MAIQEYKEGTKFTRFGIDWCVMRLEYPISKDFPTGAYVVRNDRGDDVIAFGDDIKRGLETA